MRWRRQTNYHNSRDYNDDPPLGTILGRVQLNITSLLDKARRPFTNLWDPALGSPQRASIERTPNAPPVRPDDR